MQKRSVRRKSCVLALVLAAVAAAGLFPTATNATLDPKTLPLVQAGDISYLGGFRLPRQTVNGSSYSFGGKAMAYNAASNSLYVGSRTSQVAEITIPTPLNSADANALPYAAFIQPFADPTEGHLAEVGPEGVTLQSLIIYNNRLYGNASVYYDAMNDQRISHFSHSMQLSELSFSGWTRVWEIGKSGFVSGFMSLVPSEWQALLGGPAVTGQCCIPIVSRTSMGPAAFAFNPSQIGQPSTAATPLLYYPDTHPTLGHWSASNPTYGSSTEMGGMQIISGTRTALYFGRHGVGPNCYGLGTANQALHETMSPEGEKYCYDPTDSSKGTHGYPYRYQMWAYDLNDFAAVKAGTKQPWDVIPYGVWELALPTPEPSVKLGSVAYDAERQILYVSQMRADQDGYEFRAVIHALQLTIATIAEEPAPAPASATTSGVTLVANKTAPQATNVSVTFTATPVDGAGPHQYKWLVNDGSSWAPVSGWTTSSQFVWTPATANANYFVGVWVRSAGNTADAEEASTSMPFAIAAPAPASTTVSGAALAATPGLTVNGGTGALTVATGSVMSVVVTNGPANPWDYLTVVPVGSPNNLWTGVYQFLNGTTTAPRVGLSNATVSVPAPTTPGMYEVRFLENGWYNRLATSGVITVTAPAGTGLPVNGSTGAITVAAGSAMSVVVTNGPANPWDYLTVVPVGSPNNLWTGVYQFLNGTTTAPSVGLSNAIVSVPAPTTPGMYEVRFLENGWYNRLATSGVITVTAPAGPGLTVNGSAGAITVARGSTLSIVVTNGPANSWDYVTVVPAGSPSTFWSGNYRFLNGTTTVPNTGMANGTVNLPAPLTAGTYEVRFNADGWYTRLATSGVITVTR